MEQDSSSAAISAELEALTSKRASLKDRLKRRREAMGTILQEATKDMAAIKASSAAAAAPGAASSKGQQRAEDEAKRLLLLSEVKKPKLDDTVAKETTSTTEAQQCDDHTAAQQAKTLPQAPQQQQQQKEPPPPTSVPAATASATAAKRGSREGSSSDGGGSRQGSKSRSSSKDADRDELMSLLATQSAKEKEDKKQREEILELLNRPTAKERTLMDTFRSAGGGGVREFCAHSTKRECMRANASRGHCDKLHFRKILQPHTDENLGDCSFLNTCFHMDNCKYIHYEVDAEDIRRAEIEQMRGTLRGARQQQQQKGPLTTPLIESHVLVAPQWVQCDLRNFDLSVLGKFSVVMADPPWDIHMELPYGTMADDEMRKLPVPSMQDDGLIFLWVTGRAMELGRECLKLWGYERVDELIWVKTNQLQRIIRTGRTGHWLNHGKEHCLVGKKGDCPKFNRGLDCDVIVAEVRATSHKPDEIYGIIERLAPGTRKIELFGRPHNVNPNWVTLGNQLDGIVIHDEEMLSRFNEVYPDGYEIVKDIVLHPRKEP